MARRPSPTSHVQTRFTGICEAKEAPCASRFPDTEPVKVEARHRGLSVGNPQIFKTHLAPYGKNGNWNSFFSNQ